MDPQEGPLRRGPAVNAGVSSLFWAPAAAGLGVSLLLAGPSLFLARRLGLLDIPGGRKAHERPTPLAGGIPFLAGAWGVSLLWRPSVPVLLGGAALTAFLAGLWDDRRRGGLPWGAKLLGQVLAGIPAGLALYPERPFLLLFFLGWAALLQNALNFQDNMNGLAAGSGLVLCPAAAFLARGPGWVPVLGMASGGALVPLLLLNFPKARLFLGDQASLLLGLTLAVLTAAPSSPGGAPDPALLWVPALPLLDLALTLLYRARRGLPLHQGDRNHLSHRLSRSGLGPIRAVLLLWILAALLGLLLPLGFRALAG